MVGMQLGRGVSSECWLGTVEVVSGREKSKVWKFRENGVDWWQARGTGHGLPVLCN